ncbi:MAG: hypothetical protein ACK49M_02985 [Actinomycetes bacterium]|jgi:hypothetical protein
MTTTDNDRRILHSAFEKACGPRPAEILMEHLPPAGWRDLATKSDVESASLLLRTDMEVEFANVRTEMRTEFANIRTEMRTEFANIRTEMRTEFANIRTEMADLRTELVSGMEKGFRSQTWKMIGAIVASQSTTMGMVALMLR